MDEADFTLPDGRRVLQTADFSAALAALNAAPEQLVALTVTFGRMAGTSGLSGDEIEVHCYDHQLLTTLQDSGHRTDRASRFVDAAIEHGGDLAAATVDIARRCTFIWEAEEVPAEWHVHTVEAPQFIRVNWERPPAAT